MFSHSKLTISLLFLATMNVAHAQPTKTNFKSGAFIHSADKKEVIWHRGSTIGNIHFIRTTPSSKFKIKKLTKSSFKIYKKGNNQSKLLGILTQKSKKLFSTKTTYLLNDAIAKQKYLLKSAEADQPLGYQIISVFSQNESEKLFKTLVPLKGMNQFILNFHNLVDDGSDKNHILTQQKYTSSSDTPLNKCALIFGLNDNLYTHYWNPKQMDSEVLAATIGFLFFT